MAKKGLTVWLFSSLTFISLVHMAEAISILFFGNQMHLLQLFPFIGEKLQNISPTIYFLASATSTLVFWALTCRAAFENPVEQFLNTVLTDAKKQSAAEAKVVNDKSEVLDAMYETIESSSETLSHVVDMVCNVRTEVKGIQPLSLTVEEVKAELANLKKEVRRMEEKGKLPLLCATCGKPLSPEFRLCPFCGESIKLPIEGIAARAYR